MTLYSKSQRSKNDKSLPTYGKHTVTIGFELPNKRNEAMHSFMFENEQFKCWHNVFLTDLNEFAKKCGVKENAEGQLNTEDFKGKQVDIEWGKSMGWNGKEYEGILKIEMSLGSIPF